ncbi:MAG: hypothetical protein R2748_22000 [Bryobacterales bacterium]
MSALYRDRPLSEEEVHALTAFFADRAETTSESSAVGRTQLLWLGLAGTAALLLFSAFGGITFAAIPPPHRPQSPSTRRPMTRKEH